MRSNGSRSTDSDGLGSAILARRRRLGLTQADLADLAGVGLAFLYQLEHGKPSVRLDKLLCVLRVLGLELRLGPGRSGSALTVHDELGEP